MRQRINRAIQLLSRNSIGCWRGTGPLVLWAALFTSQAFGQSEGLRLVESAPVAPSVSNSAAEATKPAPKAPLFIRQPSKLWSPERFTEPAMSEALQPQSLGLPPSVFQLVSDPATPQKQSLADLAFPPAPSKVPDGRDSRMGNPQLRQVRPRSVKWLYLGRFQQLDRKRAMQIPPMQARASSHRTQRSKIRLTRQRHLRSSSHLNTQCSLIAMAAKYRTQVLISPRYPCRSCH